MHGVAREKKLAGAGKGTEKRKREGGREGKTKRITWTKSSVCAHGDRNLNREKK